AARHRWCSDGHVHRLDEVGVLDLDDVLPLDFGSCRVHAERPAGGPATRGTAAHGFQRPSAGTRLRTGDQGGNDETALGQRSLTKRLQIAEFRVQIPDCRVRPRFAASNASSITIWNPNLQSAI